MFLHIKMGGGVSWCSSLAALHKLCNCYSVYNLSQYSNWFRNIEAKNFDAAVTTTVTNIASGVFYSWNQFYIRLYQSCILPVFSVRCILHLEEMNTKAPSEQNTNRLNTHYHKVIVSSLSSPCFKNWKCSHTSIEFKQKQV